MECPPLLHYKAEKRRTLGTTYGIKKRCYWEHIGNMLGTNKRRKMLFP